MKFTTYMMVKLLLVGTATSQVCYKHVPDACIRGNDIFSKELQGKRKIEDCKKVCSANDQCVTVDYYKELSICQLKSDDTFIKGCYGTSAGKVDSYMKISCEELVKKGNGQKQQVKDKVTSLWEATMNKRITELKKGIADGLDFDEIKEQVNDLADDLRIRQQLLGQIVSSEPVVKEPQWEFSGKEQEIDNLFLALPLLATSLFILNFFNTCCVKGQPQKKFCEFRDESAALSSGQSSWFCVHYFDFCYGDKDSEQCFGFEEAKRMVLSKPRHSGTAYQWWAPFNRLFEKPAGHRAHYTNAHTGTSGSGPGNLFIFGVYTGISKNGKYLMYMEGYNVRCNESNLEYRMREGEVTDVNQAKDFIGDLNDQVSTYFWCTQTKTIIRKSPYHQHKFFWDNGDGALFCWADKIIR